MKDEIVYLGTYPIFLCHITAQDIITEFLSLLYVNSLEIAKTMFVWSHEQRTFVFECENDTQRSELTM